MGIVAGGTYLPLHRLDRGRIAAALGTPGGGGTRTVAAADEDTTTLGVEAARNALAGLPAEAMPRQVLFATAEPAYLDKTNATTIHAALGLPTFGRRVRRGRRGSIGDRCAPPRRCRHRADARRARRASHRPARECRRA